jgi:hypothetical protein
VQSNETEKERVKMKKETGKLWKKKQGKIFLHLTEKKDITRT